jgi:hypothetical protein
MWHVISLAQFAPQGSAQIDAHDLIEVLLAVDDRLYPPVAP